MATLTPPSPSPATLSDPRQARTVASRLVAAQTELATTRRLRAIGGALVVLVAAGVLVATVVGLGVPPHEDPVGTVVWGTVLVARTALAVGAVYVLGRGLRWARSPWRLRTELVDTLGDAALLAGPSEAERLAERFAAPSRWWAPDDEARAWATLGEIAAEVDVLAERQA